MPSYDFRYDPPAPIALASLKNPSNGMMLLDIPMLLDSGADITLLPHYVVDALGLNIDTQTAIELQGFDGNRSSSGVVEVHLSFESLTFRGNYVLTPSGMGVVGRDILNLITLTLKGKELVWEASKSQ